LQVTMKKRGYIPGDFAVAIENVHHAENCKEAARAIKHAEAVSRQMRKHVQAKGGDLTVWKRLHVRLALSRASHKRVC
jgi:hypothetical protein